MISKSFCAMWYMFKLTQGYWFIYVTVILIMCLIFENTILMCLSWNNKITIWMLYHSLFSFECVINFHVINQYHTHTQMKHLQIIDDKMSEIRNTRIVWNYAINKETLLDNQSIHSFVFQINQILGHIKKDSRKLAVFVS